MSKFAVCCVLSLVVACAEAGTSQRERGGPDAGDEGPTPDVFVPDGYPDAAPIPATPDAAPIPATPDAAPIPGTPDAAPGGGLFCTTNADCPAPDDCCFLALCVPGVEFGDLCLPAE